MKKTNVIWLIFGIIFIVLLVIWFGMETTEELKIENNQEDIVKQYIEDNISELSPENAVLGGTFFVTNIDFIEEDLVLVEYEDGHIALKAHAKYSIINNEVTIDYFRLIEEREESRESVDKQDLVYSYIEDNISELSPEEAVLGGTFYVTNIDFIDENLAIVEYEDGHIALEAQVIYSIVNNRVNINSFQILQDEEDLVISYIENNISELSPVDEVLGGTFFVTNIKFIDENSAIVEYEDGHIALQAEATYSITDNQVSIDSFQLLEKDEEELVTNYIKENISELSPEEEVLGGTFFVTNIDFVSDSLAIVEYEDGHIALEAETMFSIENNKVTIESFKLID